MAKGVLTVVPLNSFAETFAVYLFADIRGFTEWSQRNQSEVRRLTSILYSIAVDSFGPRRSTKYLHRIVKFLGDGFFAVSEYDDDVTADLDKRLFDTLQAVIRFDVSFRAAISKTNLHSRSDLGIGYGMSFGASFRFRTAGQPFDYIGNPVNFASRLCSKALTSEILVDRDVRERLSEIPERVKDRLEFKSDTIDLSSFGQTPVCRINLQPPLWKSLIDRKWISEFVQSMAKMAGRPDQS